MQSFKNNVFLCSGKMRDRNVAKRFYCINYISALINFIAFSIIYCYGYRSFRLPSHIIALDDMHETDISSENNV